MMKARSIITTVALIASLLAPLLSVMPNAVVHAAAKDCSPLETFSAETVPKGTQYGFAYVLKSSGGCVSSGCPGNGATPPWSSVSLPGNSTSTSGSVLLQIQCSQKPNNPTVHWTCPSQSNVGGLAADVQCLFPDNKGSYSNGTIVTAGNAYSGCSNIGTCDVVTKFIDPAIAFLSVLVGVVVVISIIIGGIQYSSAGGDPSKVSAAKNRIRSSLLALVVFIFLFALLSFLLPVGL